VSRIWHGILVPRRRLGVERFFQNERAADRGTAITRKFALVSSAVPWLLDWRGLLHPAGVFWFFLYQCPAISGQRIVFFEISLWPSPLCSIINRVHQQGAYMESCRSLKVIIRRFADWCRVIVRRRKGLVCGLNGACAPVGP
jgi:hypothetical protein